MKFMLLFFILFVNYCNKTVSINQNLLVYDNYIGNSVPLPANIDSFLSKEVSMDTIRVNQIASTSKGNNIAFDYDIQIFLYNQEIINGWLSEKNEPDSVFTKDAGFVPLPKDKNKTIEITRQNYKLNYIGSIKISEHYNSILIQTNYDDVFLKSKNIYLLNYDDGIILSMVKVAYLVQGEDVFEGKTIIEVNGIFTLVDKFSDQDTESNSVRFLINKKGKVQLL